MDVISQIKSTLESKFFTILNDDWIRKCVQFIQNGKTVGNFSSLLPLVEDQFLLSSLENSSLGSFRQNLSSLASGSIVSSTHLVQIDDLVNISEPSDRRYTNSRSANLKLMLFDGKQRISAFEFSRVPQLSVSLPLGIKV